LRWNQSGEYREEKKGEKWDENDTKWTRNEIKMMDNAIW
jgi:hypothetical protein